MQGVPQVEQWERDLGRYRRIGLDTNIIIYALENKAPYDELAVRLLSLVESGQLTAVVSTVVQAEVLVNPIRRRDVRLVGKVELFFGHFPHLRMREVDVRVAKRAASIRADTRWPLPDAIVVATALEERCDAMVGNDRRLANGAIGAPYLYMENYLK